MKLGDVIEKFGSALSGFWTGLVSGAAAIGAALILGGADWKEGVPWEQAVPFIGACGVWIGSEFVRWQKTRAVSPQDLKLSRDLRSVFDKKLRFFLREHSFGMVFHESETEGLDRLRDRWKGVEYEFQDAALKSSGDEVVAKIRGFMSKLNNSIGVAERYPPTSYSVPTDRERAFDIFEDETNVLIGELDRMAADVLRSYEEFERVFRSKAPAEFA